MELTIDQVLQKGIEAHKAGQVQEADRLYTAILQAQPKHPDANHNMGVLAIGVDKVQEALPFLKTALEANPNIVQFWLSYIDALIKLDRLPEAKAVFDQAKSNGVKGDGFDVLEHRLEGVEASEATVSQNQDLPQDQLQPLISLYGQGQLQEALEQASQLLKQFPNSSALYNIQGAANAGLGQLDTAIGCYKKALAIKPDYAEAYSNMGVALVAQSKVDDALEAYDKALAIQPDYAEAHFNLGILLQAQGAMDQAIEAYSKALSLKPDYADAYINMGNALKEQGDLDKAVEAYNKAISLKPDYVEAYYNFGIVLDGLTFKKPKPDLQKTITALLDKKSYVRPRDISKAAISLLKFEACVQKLFQNQIEGQIGKSLLAIIPDLTKLPLLLRLMGVCPLADLKLEKGLTNIRSALLLSNSELKPSPDLLQFQSALALQCFTNEYVYNQSAGEIKELQALENSVKKMLSNGEQPSPQSVLCLASYRALHEYEWSVMLTATDAIDEVFTRQFLEPNEEACLKLNIPALEEITNDVSSKVRQQYEASPYPRWVNLGLRFEPAPIYKMVDEIKLKLCDDRIKDFESPDILIAGCGTGQHSIGTATNFKNSKVLAIDLSLSSLAYAKRKTEELGVQNIEYLQADILDLGKLDRQFDIVESGGVLHHMDDPMAGWRVLTDCLKSGGLMKIGLYSELARQHIVEMRQEIGQSGIGSSDLAMKSFRNEVINSNKEHHKNILNSSDLYSLSTLRDLLFHVQEHRFSIPQIQDCLSELGLKFCGFQANKIVQNFKLNNTGADDPYDLDKWHAFEKFNPRAFGGMYQFWCQRVA